MDDATWTALALTLTLLGAAGTWLALRRRGVVAGLRGAGLTLLVPAAWLTDTLRMFTRIADAVGDWALGLALSPVVWTGIVLAGVSVLRLGTASVLSSRGVGTRSRPAVEAAPERRGAPAIDDDLADIEALLKRRGIS